MAVNCITWIKAAGELARQQELFAVVPRETEILVAPGTVALVWRDSTLSKTLSPGRYPLSQNLGASWWGSERPHVLLSWVDTEHIPYDFLFPQIRSCDNVPVAVKLQFTSLVHIPSLFVMAMLRERDVCLEHELKARLFDELRNAVSDWLVLQSIHSLGESRAHKESLEQSLRSHLYHSWERTGIRLERLVSVSFHNPDVEALRDFSSLSSLQSVQKQTELSLAQQSLRREHSLTLLQLEQQHQVAATKQQTKQQLAAADQRHEIALAKEKTMAQLEQELQQVEAQEKIKERQVCGHIGRQKYQVAAEGKISQIVMETQKKRASVALEIAEQKSDFEFRRAQLQIRLEEMRQSLRRKS
jgi:hypothetical protein